MEWQAGWGSPIQQLKDYYAIQMIGRSAILVALLALLALAIDQTCSDSNQCPSNAECDQSNDYCVCEGSFIGSCNVSSQAVSSSSVSSSLTPNLTNLYSTQPQQLNRFIEFTYTICQNNSSQLVLTFTLWGQSGQNTQYNAGNALVSPAQATLGTGCSNILTPPIEFGLQPNGQNEMLILGITDNSAVPVTINISVSQKLVLGFLIYYYILIGLGAFVILFIIVGGTIFMARRRRLRALGHMADPSASAPAAPETNDITYFDIHMPSLKGEALGAERLMCPICLMQIDKRDVVRKTPCTHCFHANCIDSWCAKNLNCPVCRSDLSFQKLTEKKPSETVSPVYHPVVQEMVEDRPEQPKIFIQQKYEIRENML